MVKSSQEYQNFITFLSQDSILHYKFKADC